MCTQLLTMLWAATASDTDSGVICNGIRSSKAGESATYVCPSIDHARFNVLYHLTHLYSKQAAIQQNEDGIAAQPFSAEAFIQGGLI